MLNAVMNIRLKKFQSEKILLPRLAGSSVCALKIEKWRYKGMISVDTRIYLKFS